MLFFATAGLREGTWLSPSEDRRTQEAQNQRANNPKELSFEVSSCTYSWISFEVVHVERDDKKGSSERWPEERLSNKKGYPSTHFEACTDVLTADPKLELFSVEFFHMTPFFRLMILLVMVSTTATAPRAHRYKYLMQFMCDNAPEAAEEIRVAYIESMGRTIAALFRAYHAQLMKLELEMANRHDLIAVEVCGETLVWQMLLSSGGRQWGSLWCSYSFCTRVRLPDI